jgi:LysR family transcriptional regulator, benzoate and cis,cis-muconate-responsive activator of ben and cat genes
VISEDLELRHLRYVVAVAEELHFGRAAARLGIAQPPLSQQIQRIERILGVELFRRTRRSVELTDVGVLLVGEARDLLAHASRVGEAIRHAAAGTAGTVRLGFVGSATHEVLPTLLRRFREDTPDARVVPEELPTTEQVAAIEAGTLDVGLVRLPIASTEVATHALMEEPLVIVLPDFHPLAHRRRLPLAALADEAFVMWGRRLNPLFHDEVISACLDAGFSPNVTQEAGEMPTIVSLVSAGLGVSLVPASMERQRTSGVVYVPMQGPGVRIAIALAWRREHPSPLVQHLVRVARETWPRK